MPHISKRLVEPEVEKQILESFTSLIKDLNTFHDTDKFLSSVLSDTEKLMIAKRITAAFLLRHNIESKKIQELLKLTPSTVFRLKLWVQTHQEGFDIIFDKLERQRRSKITKEIFYKLLDYAIKASARKMPNPFKKLTEL